MWKLFLTIISLAVYFGGGWVAKDILFSVIEITDDMTFRDIFYYEALVYSFLTEIIILVICIIDKGYNSFFDEPLVDRVLGIGLLLFITFQAIKIFPLSMGLVILYNIINIGCVIWVIIKTET